MRRTLATNAGRGAALLCALIGLILLATSPSAGAGISALQQKLSAGRDEASSLVGELQATQGELAAAEGEATKAKAREQKLTTLLATGEEKAARLAAEVRKTQHQLVSDLVDRAFGGSAAALVMQALSANSASAEELSEIEGLIDAHKRGKTVKSRKTSGDHNG